MEASLFQAIPVQAHPYITIKTLQIPNYTTTANTISIMMTTALFVVDKMTDTPHNT